MALSYTGAGTRTACWEERPQVCGEVRLALVEVRRRTPTQTRRHMFYNRCKEPMNTPSWDLICVLVSGRCYHQNITLWARLTHFLEKYSRSIARYNTAFCTFVKLAMEMNFDFPNLGVPAVVSVISTLHLASQSQALNADAALLLFPSLHCLKFEPMLRALRREWNTSVPPYACFWSGKSLLLQLADTVVPQERNFRAKAGRTRVSG